MKWAEIVVRSNAISDINVTQTDVARIWGRDSFPGQRLGSDLE